MQGARPRDFVVVANRLPVDLVEQPDNGPARWQRSPGGLVTALEPVLRSVDGSWVGWTGTADAALDPFVEDGLTLQEAIDHPRLHVHRAATEDEEIKVEDPDHLSMYFGGVGAALTRPDGHLVAAADPRRDGAVRLVHPGRP